MSEEPGPEISIYGSEDEALNAGAVETEVLTEEEPAHSEEESKESEEGSEGELEAVNEEETQSKEDLSSKDQETLLKDEEIITDEGRSSLKKDDQNKSALLLKSYSAKSVHKSSKSLSHYEDVEYIHPSQVQPEYDYNDKSVDDEEEVRDEEFKSRLVMEEVKEFHIDKVTITPFLLDLMCKKNKDKTKHLILRGNRLIHNLKRRLRDIDLKVICPYLKKNESIIALDMSYNNITSEGIRFHLVPLLKGHIALKELVLSNNDISLKALESLANIASHLRLTTLKLNGNKLGPKSGEFLAKLIENARHLVHLDVSETDQTVSSLACLTAILNKDYIPCYVKHYPFSRQNPDSIGTKPVAKKKCSPSSLALYVRQLVSTEKEKDQSTSSISSSMKYRFKSTSIDDFRILDDEEISISSITNSELNRYIQEKQGNKKEIEMRRVMKTSLPDVSLPAQHAIKMTKEKDLNCCMENSGSLLDMPYRYMGRIDEYRTSIVDVTLPAEMDLKEKSWFLKKDYFVDKIKRDACNREIKKNKSFVDLIALGNEIPKASLTNVNIPPKRGGGGTCSTDMTNYPRDTCDSICTLLQTSQSISSSIHDPSDRSNYHRRPILKILFLDRILGHYHCQPLTYHFARILSEMLKNNDSLIELHLEKNSLIDNDIEVLCEGLQHNTTLKLLDLSANQVTSVGIFRLAECLPQTRLEALILNHNNISDYGARCFFFALPSTNLKMLDIAYNKITDLGMMYMLYTMKKMPKVLTLFIWGNPITDSTLMHIKKYLVQGWLLTDSLDIKLYEVDGILHHGLRPADSFKTNYYMQPRSSDTCDVPSQSVSVPLEFEYYKSVYPRIMSKYIPHKSFYAPNLSKSCTT